MRTYAFIFARGGSKGLPRKNILKIKGIPLLAHSINVANSINEIAKCFVSTDSPEIAEVASNYGATVIHRPAELSTDSSPEWLSWQHAVNWVRSNIGDFEKFISLPATAPLRLPKDIERCLSRLDSETDIVLTMSNSQRNPWFNMVCQDKNKNLELIIKEENNFIRRQDAPVSYDLTTVAYVTYPDFIMKNSSIWDGRSKGVIIPPDRAIDIDTDLDFRIATFLMESREAYVKK
jgi:CMP-N-acetylneuraminic acid synthetase